MKRLWVLPLLLLVSVANAEPNEAQRLKARGLLPNVRLADVATADVPETVAAADEQQCGHPDALDLELSYAEPIQIAEMLGVSIEEAAGLQLAHERMALAATGRGAYPPNCNPQYPGVHAVSYVDNPDSWPPHLRRPLTDEEFQKIIEAKVWGPSGDPNGRPFTMAELKTVWGGKPLNSVVNDFVEETYRRLGVILYRVGGAGNITVSYPVIPSSVIGIGWFPDSSPCPGDRVNLHIDKTYTSGFQGQLGLKIHELGHCVQLQHQFSGQGSHQEPMSYSYSNHLVVGYSTGDAVFGIPKSPSVAVLTRLYGGEPVGVPWKGKFATTPGPTPPPTGTGPVKIGDLVTITVGPHRLEAIVSSVTGDDGPSLGKRIIDALAAIPAYGKKQQHTELMILIYSAVSEAVAKGELTPAQGQEALVELRTGILDKDVPKWSSLLAIADSVNTAAGIAQVAGGLGGQSALSPEVVKWIARLAEWIPQIFPTGKWGPLIQLILTLLGGLNDEEPAVEQPADPLQPIRVSPPAAQKTGAIQPGDFRNFMNILYGIPLPVQPAVERKPVYTPARPIQTKFDADEARFGLVP